MIQAQPISIRHNHSYSQDLISSHFHAMLTITNSRSSHANSIPDPSPTIHNSYQTGIILHYIHVSHHTIHTQNNINHPKINKHPNSVQPRPTPRSGWRASLRRDVLAQASPPSPRRGLKKESRSTCGISLRRGPSRLGEVLARSKRRAGRPFAQKP